MRRHEVIARSLVLVCLLAAFGRGIGAQSTEQPSTTTGEPRPKIGLALSGGGARGGAHIGVLKALDELKVPVDYIAGTSIGAVVGGFFVSGMTVEDLENLVESLEWERAFLNTTPRKLKSFRRKRDDDLFLVNQKPGLNHGEFELPAGLTQGQVIDLILSRETLRASAVDNFDDLAIPFRAVAADIATGKAVVLGSGSLARSLRASMSIPAALAPVELDGHLLVDGGIAMNLPVEVAQDMGADVVIAVDISSDLLPRETLRSVIDVATQLTNLLTRGGTDEQRARLGPKDVLIAPKFDEELSSVSFERMRDAIQTGYDTVMSQRAQLEPLALNETDYAAYLASRNDPRMRDLPVVDFVHLENHSPIADSVIETRLGDIKIGETLDVGEVERAISKVYGLEYYQNVRYELETQGDQTGLDVVLDERSWGPNYLQLGMEYSAAGHEDALFGLAASYLRTAINPLGGEARATVVVGDEPALLTDLYQPFGDKGLFFVAPALNLDSSQYNVFEGDDRVTEAQIHEAQFELGIGRELPTWGEVRFGVRFAAGNVRLRVGDPTLIPTENYRLGEYFASFGVDTMDSIGFPRSGTLANVEWRTSRADPLGADADFDQVLVSSAHAKTWGRHTVLTTLRYDVTRNGVAPLRRMFRLGGFFDISGLNRNQFSGQQAVRVGTSYYRRIGNFALFPAFAGVSFELGDVFNSRDEISLRNAIFGGSLWAGISTPVGPIYVAYGRTDGGKDALYVSLGRIF